jgi:hypothetical protein
VPQLHDIAIRLDHLIGIARSQHHQAGLGAEGRKLLYRLMARAIFPIPHRIMCEYKDGGQLHQS